MNQPASGRGLRCHRDLRTGAVGHILRTRPDLQPVPLPDAEKPFADLGHPNPRLRTDHRILSRRLRAALLRLWNL